MSRLNNTFGQHDVVLKKTKPLTPTRLANGGDTGFCITTKKMHDTSVEQGFYDDKNKINIAYARDGIKKRTRRNTADLRGATFARRFNSQASDMGLALRATSRLR